MPAALLGHSPPPNGLLMWILHSRSMSLLRSPQMLLHLADTGLQDLEWAPYNSEHRAMKFSAVKKLTDLTRLTKLQLHAFDGVDSSLHSVQTFVHLRELRLYHCQHMDREFFVPGALQSLQTLCVLEADKSDQDMGVQGRRPDAEEGANELSEVGEFLSKLPWLSRISGAGRVYEIGIASCKQITPHD